MNHVPSPKRSAIAEFLRRLDGPLTRELDRKPGGFGLGQVPAALVPDRTTTAVCGFCATGCGLSLHLQRGHAVNLTPAADYPVNAGTACPKGWEALAPLDAKDRATRPLLRDTRGRLQPISWAEALSTFTTRMKGILAEHGPESVAFLSTGQICTEEMALLGAFAKMGMGLVHGDGNTRQCMATAVVAYKESFGFDAPPYTYADFEESDVLVFVGANPCIAHPVLWSRVLANKRSPEIVVVDPRRTETAVAATRHLAIRPKSDLVLFYAIARELIAHGRIDQEFVEAHTEGFEAYADLVAEFDLARAQAETGIDAATIAEIARLIGSGKRVSFWWTMGVNQSHQGVRTAQSLIALSLMTGNVGKPGTGANSITGQCNAMGSRLFSNTTNLFGGRDFQSEADRNDVAGILGIEPSRIPDRPSLAYDQIIEGIHRGKIRGLWVIATNTAHSWINQNDAKELLSKLDFLVVQDMYETTETARLSHLVLPAAGWGEKEGTFINAERRIGLTKKVRRPPGEALSDFDIVRLLAASWGVGEMFDRWTSPEAAFEILKELSAGRPCDIGGITDYAMLDRLGGIQWPLPAGSTVGRASQRRLFEDSRFFTSSGRARFVGETPRPMPEPTDEAYPLLLMTGRGSAAEWHTRTRTSKSAVLAALAPSECYVELHPDDAAARGITANDLVEVRSKRGSLRARAHVTRIVQSGQVFVPMHDANTNRLTHPSFDPYSRQPSYKACAVEIERTTD